MLAIGAARYVLLIAGWADPVAGRAVATPVLAQGRGGGPGHRAHRRRIRSARPPRRDDRGRRRVAAAGRVVRPRRDLAVPHRRRPAHPPGSAAGRHRACGRARVGCSPRARPCLAVHPRRLYPHPRGGAGTGCCRAGAAGLAATDRGRHRWSPVRPAHSRQDPQHSVLEEIGRAFNPVYDWGDIGPAIGVVRDSIGPTLHHMRSSRSGSASSCLSAPSWHQRSTSPPWPPGIAAPRFAASLPSPRSGGCARACRCSSSRDSRSPRPALPGWPSRRCAPPRPRSATSVISRGSSAAPIPRPASPLRTCSPDCAARTSSSPSSKATGRSPSRAPASPRASTPSCASAPPRWPAPAGPRRAPGSPPPASAGSASSRTPPCSRGCGLTAKSGMPS